jgi:hypothetical protein
MGSNYNKCKIKTKKVEIIKGGLFREFNKIGGPKLKLKWYNINNMLL